MKKTAVFLDRDGTINEQVGYVNHVDRIWLLPGAAKAIRKLNRLSIPAIVVSNQAGAARGYFPAVLIDHANERLESLLALEEAFLDDIYYCPHLPGAKVPSLDIDCSCRKPKPGMLLKAAKDHEIELEKSYMVGDRMGDISFAHSVGCKAILVLSGYGKGEREHIQGPEPEYVARDLYEAILWILKDMHIYEN